MRKLPPADVTEDRAHGRGTLASVLLSPRTHALLLLLAALPMVIVASLHASGQLHAYALLGDLRGMVELPIYAGWLSELGVLLWWSSASAAALAALCAAVPAAERRWLLASAAITAWLALDDAWLLHERVLPRAGLEQEIVYLLYVSIVLLWLLRWRRLILRRHAPRLGVALALFACSVGLDALPDRLRPFGDNHIVVEDGAKWLGIVAWSLWLWGTSVVALGGGGGGDGGGGEDRSGAIART